MIGVLDQTTAGRLLGDMSALKQLNYENSDLNINDFRYSNVC